MPFSIEIDHKQHLVIAKFWGVFDSSEFEEELAAMDRLGPFNESYRLLHAFSELVQYVVSTDALRNAARRRSEWKWPEKLPFHPDAKRVIFAASDLVFGLARLYDTETYKEEFTVVRTIAEAAAELAMDVADIDASFPA